MLTESPDAASDRETLICFLLKAPVGCLLLALLLLLLLLLLLRLSGDTIFVHYGQLLLDALKVAGRLHSRFCRVVNPMLARGTSDPSG